jgi:hypothetical protein
MNEDKIAEINTLVRKNSKNELVRLCKEKNLSVSGTKHDMAMRLMGQTTINAPEQQKNVKKIIIQKNQKGVWEFDGLVFEEKTKNVVGYLDEEGKTQPLQRKHIEKCRQYKFLYSMPEILDERPDAIKTCADDISSEEENEEEEEEET